MEPTWLKITQHTKNHRRNGRFRRLLQIAVCVGAAIPFAAGLMGVMRGTGMITPDAAANISLDSHYRYLSAILMGIGISFWTMVPAIERKTALFRLLTALVMLGGTGRLYSMLLVGTPNGGMVFGLGMELVVMPMLALWQTLIARHAQN